MSAKLSASDDFDFDRKRKMRRRITLELKMEVLRRIEAGERQADVSRSFGIPESSIRTIWKNADAVRVRSCFAPSLLAKQLTRFRSNLVERMEVMLSEWIDEQPDCGNIPLSVVMGRARSIFNYLKQEAGSRAAQEQFTASRGWYHRFKRRMSLRVMAEGQKGGQFGCRVIKGGGSLISRVEGKPEEVAYGGAEYANMLECKIGNGEDAEGEDEQENGMNDDSNHSSSSDEDNIALSHLQTHSQPQHIEVPQPLGIELEPHNLNSQQPMPEPATSSASSSALEDHHNHLPATIETALAQEERVLSQRVLSEGLGKIYEALELFAKNDPDWYRSTEVKANVLNSVFCYSVMMPPQQQQREEGKSLLQKQEVMTQVQQM